MSNIIKSGSTSDLLKVNTDNEALVALTKTRANAGYSLLLSENDAGSVVATQRRSPRTSVDQRLSVGIDTLLDSDRFNYANRHTGKYNETVTTTTVAYSGGFLQLNSTAITTTTTGAYVQTRQFFQIPEEGALVFETMAQLSAVNAANVESYFGWFFPNGSTGLPLDGIYLKINSTGIFGIANNNGSESPTSVFTATASANTNLKLRIVINTRQADFYVNDVLQASLTAAVGLGALTLLPSLPVSFQTRNTGVAGVGTTVKIGGYSLWSSDTNSGKSYSIIKSLQGNSYQGQQGGTMGSLAKYTNSTNATAAVATNTTAALGTGLGGEFWETDTLAVNLDGVIASFQNPTSTVNVQGKNMIIHGVWIDSYIQTALTGGGYNAVWTIAYGHTAVSMATAEAPATKAPRRVPIGSNTVASGLVALSQLTRVYVQFVNAIVVYPSEFFAIVKKKVGTAPSAGVVAHLITVDHYFE